MKRISSPPDSVAAVWAACSPQAIAEARILPNSPDWKELQGKDTWVYMRLTKAAARILAERLLEAVAAAENNEEVLCGRPQGAWMDELSDDESGIYLHPNGASVTIRVVDMPTIDKLMEARETASDPLAPLV